MCAGWRHQGVVRPVPRWDPGLGRAPGHVATKPTPTTAPPGPTGPDGAGRGRIPPRRGSAAVHPAGAPRPCMLGHLDGDRHPPARGLNIGGLLSVRQAKVAQAPPGVAAGAFLEPAGTVLALLRMEKFSPSIAGMAPPEVIPFPPGRSTASTASGSAGRWQRGPAAHAWAHRGASRRPGAAERLPAAVHRRHDLTLRHLAVDQVRPVALSRRPGLGRPLASGGSSG